MTKMINTIDYQILRRICGHGRGWGFTPDHFKVLGSCDAIASPLKQYKHDGFFPTLYIRYKY